MDLGISGKRALIVGGAGSIGQAITKALSSEGVLCAISGRDHVAVRIKADGLKLSCAPGVFPLQLDVCQPESIEAAMLELERAFGSIDILVNCAGRQLGAEPERFGTVGTELLRRDFEEKIVGYLGMARRVADGMKARRWGRLISLGGVAVRKAGPISAGARNAALVNLNKNMAVELGRFGITVNLIQLGTTVTPDIRERLAAAAASAHVTVDEYLLTLGEATNIGRLVTAEEVGAAVAFLSSPQASAVTGEVISITGGMGVDIRY